MPTLSSRRILGTSHFYVQAKHANLPNDKLVGEKILEILGGADPSPIPGAFQTQPFSRAFRRGFTCSPVRMQVSDSQGNLTGLGLEGDVLQEIPGSDFFVFPSNEAVFLPATGSLQVLLKALDNGVFSVTFDTFTLLLERERGRLPDNNEPTLANTCPDPPLPTGFRTHPWLTEQAIRAFERTTGFDRTD